MERDRAEEREGGERDRKSVNKSRGAGAASNSNAIEVRDSQSLQVSLLLWGVVLGPSREGRFRLVWPVANKVRRGCYINIPGF